MKWITIDGSQFDSISEIHMYLAEQLEFPEYYGRNLDALWDMLTSEVDLPLTIEWITCSKDGDSKYIAQLNSLHQLFLDVMEEMEGFELIVVNSQNKHTS